MTDVTRAIEQIAEIHEQLGRSAVFRGWRSVPVALSGIAGLAAAAWQSFDPRPLDPWRFAAYWAIVGVAALVIGCVEVAWHYAWRAGDVERARSRQVIGQFLPALVAGALVTGAFVRIGPDVIALLPGVWALFFGVGIFATRPAAPRGAGWVALYYWTAGLALLWSAHGADGLSPWAVGGTFGAGQLVAALILYTTLERTPRRDAQN